MERRVFLAGSSPGPQLSLQNDRNYKRIENLLLIPHITWGDRETNDCTARQYGGRISPGALWRPLRGDLARQSCGARGRNGGSHGSVTHENRESSKRDVAARGSAAGRVHWSTDASFLPPADA